MCIFSRAIAFCSYDAAQSLTELRKGQKGPCQKRRKTLSGKCLHLQISQFPQNFPVGKSNNLYMRVPGRGWQGAG